MLRLVPKALLALALLGLSAGLPAHAAPVPVDAANVPHWGAWALSTAEREHAESTFPTSIGIDSRGSPHILHTLWTEDGRIAPYYYRLDAAGWVREQVAARGWARAIAVDRYDTVHIVYDARVNFSTEYVRIEDGVWTREFVPGGEARETALVIDDADVVHAIFSHHEGLKHAWRDPATTSWSVETVDTAVSSAHANDAAIDSAGRLHVAYAISGGQHGQVKYAYQTPTGWASELVVSRCGFYVALALDPTDTPHVLCSDRTRGLYHYEKQDGAWIEQPVAPGTYSGDDPALRIDDTGRLHAVYSTPRDFSWRDNPFRPQQLTYATRTPGSPWVHETVDRIGGGNGNAASLTLDANSIPHVSYVRAYALDSVRPPEPFAMILDLRYATPLVNVGNVPAALTGVP